jgi:hypothetical protein
MESSMETASPTLFEVHRWIASATTCDYPLLAVAQDRSALLALGDYSLSFDLGIPNEAQDWLAHEFAPMGQTVRFDLSTVRTVVAATFPSGAECGIVHFDDQLRVTRFELGLAAQQEAELSAEYVILGPGKYRRQGRDPDRLLPVSAAEKTLLDVCVATFTELATQHGALLRQPLPPRFRGTLGGTLSN